MTIDSQGNVYLTGKGVTVFDPAGEKIEHIDVQEPWTGNICFGGKDRQTAVHYGQPIHLRAANGRPRRGQPIASLPPSRSGSAAPPFLTNSKPGEPKWCALQDLNLRPLPCEGSALPLS